MRAFIWSHINSPNNQVTALPFFLSADRNHYYNSLTNCRNWNELMRVLGQPLRCIKHEPVYLSRMLTCEESEFPPHAAYVRKF